MAGKCGTCEAELPENLTLCWKHTVHLGRDLVAVSGVWSELMTTAARMDAGTRSEIRGASGSREPANLDALDKGQTMRVVLGGWASMIPWNQPIADPPKIAAWLLGDHQISFIRKQDWASDFKEELRECVIECRKVTDRKLVRVFAGMCPTRSGDGTVCDTAVYTTPGRPAAVCRKCDAVWDVTEWRERALEYAMKLTGTPAELSRMLSDPVTGEALPQGTIRQWVNRGKLAAIDVNGKGRHVYQVRKVRNLWDRSRNARNALQQTA